MFPKPNPLNQVSEYSENKVCRQRVKTLENTGSKNKISLSNGGRKVKASTRVEK